MTATEANGSGKAVRTFPAGFVWGDAAAAYQIEGATTTDGRGPSAGFCQQIAIGNELAVAWTGESSGLAASTA